MKQLLKNFVYGLLPYSIVGVLTALILGFNIIHTLVVIIVMVSFNIAVNVLKELLTKPQLKNLLNGTGSKK